MALGPVVAPAHLTEVDQQGQRAVFAEHHALFFPGQRLEPHDLVRVMRSFGEPLVHPYLTGLTDQPQVHELRKSPDDVTGSSAIPDDRAAPPSWDSARLPRHHRTGAVPSARYDFDGEMVPTEQPVVELGGRLAH